MSLKHRLLATFLVIIGSACASASPLPPTETGTITSEIRRPSETIFPRGTVWILPQVTTVASYRLRNTNTIERYPAGAVSERDSSSTVADITISLARSGDSVRIQIRGSNFEHTPGNRTAPQQPSPERSVLVGAIAVRARIVADSIPPAIAPTPTACHLSESSSMIWLKLQAVTIPTRLQPGQEWQDTITVSGCTGKVPTTLTSRRFYQVTRALRQDLIQLDRTDSLELRGTGPLGGRLVSITGQGHGATSIQLDVRSGTIAVSRGSHEISLVVEASGHRTRFVQRVEDLLANTSGY